ncbi:MAG: hypothetical protein Q8L50_01495 [Polaromonas sp.]|nr:hypothetical protein [Polaromonas sp.]
MDPANTVISSAMTQKKICDKTAAVYFKDRTAAPLAGAGLIGSMSSNAGSKRTPQAVRF